MKKNNITIEDETVNSFKPQIRENPFNDSYRKIKSIRLKKLNLDKECAKDIESGIGFYITNEEDFDEKRGVRTDDGLYSPKFGIDTFSDKNTDSLYHCECGKLTGGVNEGDYCPFCGTQVCFSNSGLDKTGWITLDQFFVINPACYPDLEVLIGAKDLAEIIKYSAVCDVNGIKQVTKNKKSPYHGIGIINFRKYFDEIIEYYRNKRKKEDVYKLIVKYKKAVFTHSIPVYTSLLRPLILDSANSKMSTFNVNKSYSIILANANAVKNTEIVPSVNKKMMAENSLYEIQTELNKICSDIIAQNLSGKKGIIRGMISSSRMDYSARFVIVPAKNHCVNEVSLPYVGGCELMRPLLINALNKIDKMNVRDANTLIDRAIRRFDKRIFILMNHIIQNSENPPMCIIQRSPSLLQESIRLMKIKEIKGDYTDLTLDVPVGVLQLMNADFDGDVVSCYMIYDNRLKSVWEPIHSPINHFISRHDGLYSSGGEFIKDSAVTLCELWEIGKNGLYYGEWASEKERNLEAARLEKENNE